MQKSVIIIYQNQYLYIDVRYIVIYNFTYNSVLEGMVRRTFCKKEKDAIKRLVKKMDLELYRIRFCIGNCEAGDVTAVCDFLLEMWNKIVHNRRGFFFTFFLGLVRELVIEVKGENCVPYLQLLCFAEKKKTRTEKEIKYLAFLSWIKVTRTAQVSQPTVVEEIPSENVVNVLDELMLPCIRINRPNKELEELLNSYQYHRRLCSRSGIVSVKNLEYYSDLER